MACRLTTHCAAKNFNRIRHYVYSNKYGLVLFRNTITSTEEPPNGDPKNNEMTIFELKLHTSDDLRIIKKFMKLLGEYHV